MRFPGDRLGLLLAGALLAGCGGEPAQRGVETLHALFADHAAEVLQGARPLEATAEGFVLRAAPPAETSRHAALDVELPRDGAGQLRLRQGGGPALTVHEVGATGAGVAAERAVAYGRPGGTSFWSAAPEGVEEWLLLDGKPAAGPGPVASWEIGGGTPRVRGDAVEVVDAVNRARIRVTAPRAYAASGRPVAARLAVRGAAIELYVDGGGEAVLVDPQWKSVAPLTQGRYRAVTALLPTGKVLEAGGQGNIDPLSTAELYDPVHDTWAPAAAMQSARDLARGVALPDGRVLVVGGYDGTAILDSAEIYDQATDAWTLTAPAPSPLLDHAVVVLADGRVLVTGGTGGLPDFDPLAAAEIYDPAAGTWVAAAPMNVPRTAHSATLLADGRVLVAGGQQADYLASAEIYDPVADTWTVTSAMSAARVGHRATLLPGGDVLVTGGDGDSGEKTSQTATRYVTATGTWVPAGFMAVPRDRHTSTLLPDGTVLVTGGCLDPRGPSVNVERYDPERDAWLCTRPMNVGRCEHTATLLLSGKVLVTGGLSNSSNTGFTASAEVFNPASNAACVQPNDCGGGYTANGVCCDSACADPCMACSKAAGATEDGVCTLVSGTPCTSLDACSQNSVCQAGFCLGTPIMECPPPASECQVSDGFPCMPGMGCTTFDQPDGTPCTGGACLAGVCVKAKGKGKGKG